MSYSRLKLFKQASLADLIVAGTISRVGSKTFDFAVREVIDGEESGPTVRVKKFVNWTCAGRWVEYEKGQELLLFLRKGVDSATYEILAGGGDEGEMPILGDQVVTENTHGYRVQGYEVATHTAAGAAIVGTALPYSELTAAIRAFRDTFAWSGTGQDAHIGPRDPSTDLDAWANTSKLSRHLLDEVRSSEAWSGNRPGASTYLDPASLRGLVARDHGFSGTARIGPDREPDDFGFEMFGRFGYSLAFLGDVNGDGFNDHAVGAPWDSYLGHFHGAVWVLFLNGEGTIIGKSLIREQYAGFGADMHEFSQLGYSLAPVGDLDGNGVPDLATGTPYWDGVGEHQGAVWVLS